MFSSNRFQKILKLFAFVNIKYFTISVNKQLLLTIIYGLYISIQSELSTEHQKIVNNQQTYLYYLKIDQNHVWMAVCCLVDFPFQKSVQNLILNHLVSTITYKMAYEVFGTQNFHYLTGNLVFQLRGMIWKFQGDHPLALICLNVLAPNRIKENIKFESKDITKHQSQSEFYYLLNKAKISDFISHTNLIIN